MHGSVSPPFAVWLRDGGPRALSAIAALLIVASLAPDASGQPSPGKPAPPPPSPAQREADERFQEGKALMEQGLIAEGCAKLARSLELMRRGGALLNLAICREKEGKFATAFALLQEALAIAAADGRAERVEIARAALEDVRTKLSWLEVAPAPGAETADLVISRDGEALPREAWGTLVPVDPGAHTITASAPGRQRYEVTVTLEGPGEKRVVEIPALAPVRVDPPPAATAARPAAVSAARPVVAAPFSAPPRADAGGGWMRPTGVAALAVGIAGLGVGGGFGVKAIVDSNETRSLCPGDVCTTEEGLDAHSDAQDAATVANIAIPAGLVLAGAGLFLLVWSPAPAASSAKAPVGLWMAPIVGQESAGASLGGAW